MIVWHLTRAETRRFEAIQADDMSDIVGLVRRLGFDPRTFFEWGDWRGVDFRGSQLTGVSFKNGNLDGVTVYEDQLALVASSGPLTMEDPIVHVRPREDHHEVPPLNQITPMEIKKPIIKIVGIGGSGGNAINNMIHSNLIGVEFLVANTDANALAGNLAKEKLQLGISITEGLGAGSRPEVGRASAEEALEQITDYLEGSHMVFLIAGMGGGTGTGAAPVIARAAREMGVLTVGVVTKPFHFEGALRMKIAEQGLKELQECVDTLIAIPNQNLFRLANDKTTFSDAFKMADDVLHSGVRGVTDLMVRPGLINLDVVDIRTVLAEMGKAMMGAGQAEGDHRAVMAAEAAIFNPLVDDVSMQDARGVLINVTGGPDMTLYEVDEAANRIRDEVDPEANIIFGAIFDERLEGRIRVSVVATGIDAEAASGPRRARPKFPDVASSKAPDDLEIPSFLKRKKT